MTCVRPAPAMLRIDNGTIEALPTRRHPSHNLSDYPPPELVSMYATRRPGYCHISVSTPRASHRPLAVVEPLFLPYTCTQATHACVRGTPCIEVAFAATLLARVLGVIMYFCEKLQRTRPMSTTAHGHPRKADVIPDLAGDQVHVPCCPRHDQAGELELCNEDFRQTMANKSPGWRPGMCIWTR